MTGNSRNRAGKTRIEDWFDLSVVGDPFVTEVLSRLLGDARMRRRWEGFTTPHRQLHQSILRGYLKTAHAPSRAVLSAGFAGAIEPALSDLVRRDLVLTESGEVVGAYPFTSRPSRHKVVIDAREIGAMCAIDALGAGAMAGRNARVRATCAHCQARIEIDVSQRGLAIRAAHPETAMIWAGLQAVSGCAADTQCRSMLMFCTGAHLQDWRGENAPDGAGFRLTPDQALQTGAAIFRHFLPRSAQQEQNQ